MDRPYKKIKFHLIRQLNYLEVIGLLFVLLVLLCFEYIWLVSHFYTIKR